MEGLGSSKGLINFTHFIPTSTITFAKSTKAQALSSVRDEKSLSPDGIYRSMTLVLGMPKFHMLGSHRALPSTEEKVLQHKQEVGQKKERLKPDSKAQKWRERLLSIPFRKDLIPGGICFSYQLMIAVQPKPLSSTL